MDTLLQEQFLCDQDAPGAQEACPARDLSCEKHCSGRKREGKRTVCLGEAVASMGGWNGAKCIFKRQELWEMTRPMNITGGRRLSGQLGEGGVDLALVLSLGCWPGASLPLVIG